MAIDNKENTGYDAFLTDRDEPEEGVEYINPDIELKLSKEKRTECRNVVREIREFGITGQRQLLYLIYLLSLEVEDRDTVQELTKACKIARKDLDDDGERKLIIPK